MLNNSPTIAIVFAIVSVLFCLAQIFLRQKVNFLAMCKVTVYIPLLSIVIKILTSNANALLDISKANDLRQPIIIQGVASMLWLLSLGIIITIVLALMHALAVAFVKNQKRE